MAEISKKHPSLLTIDDSSFLTTLPIYDLQASKAVIINVTELLLNGIDDFKIEAKLEETKFVIEWTSTNKNDYQRLKKVEEKLKNRVIETLDWGQIFRRSMLARISGNLLCTFNRGVIHIKLEIP